MSRSADLLALLDILSGGQAGELVREEMNKAFETSNRILDKIEKDDKFAQALPTFLLNNFHKNDSVIALLGAGLTEYCILQAARDPDAFKSDIRAGLKAAHFALTEQVNDRRAKPENPISSH